jgi:hypothetical protein
VAQACGPSYLGSTGRTVSVKGSQGNQCKALSEKQTKSQKGLGDVPQVVECLPVSPRLSSVPSSAKTTQKIYKGQTITIFFFFAALEMEPRACACWASAPPLSTPQLIVIFKYVWLCKLHASQGSLTVSSSVCHTRKVKVQCPLSFTKNV